MFNKLIKLVRLCVRVNLWQTWLLHKKIKHPRSASLHVYNYSLINVAKSAELILDERSYFGINVLNIKRAKITPCTLWLGDNTRMDVHGRFFMYEGAAIVICNGGHLEIGNNTYMNMSLIQCAHHITIGDNCAIAGDVLIQDTDFHLISDENGNEKNMFAPIHIGNHVWICANVTILKGVTIGDGAVIGAGSVVTKSIPPRCLAVGNPAKVIKENVVWR